MFAALNLSTRSTWSEEVSSIWHLICYHLQSRIFLVFSKTFARGFGRLGGLIQNYYRTNLICSDWSRSHMNYSHTINCQRLKDLVQGQSTTKLSFCSKDLFKNSDLSDTNHFQLQFVRHKSLSVTERLSQRRLIDQRSLEVQNSWGLEQNTKVTVTCKRT